MAAMDPAIRARAARRRPSPRPLVAMAAVALVASLAVAVATPSAAANGSFTIAPTEGPPGTTVELTGSCGFAAETVSYGVFGEPSTFHFFEPLVSTDGTFSGQLVIPASAPAGSTWPVSVTCDLTKSTQADLGTKDFTVPTGGAAQLPASYAVTVAGTPYLVPGFWISPGSGPVGTTITITGFCGYPADSLSYSLTYPDEANLPIPSVYVLGEALAPSDLGSFTVSLKVPAEGLEVPQYPGPHPVLPGLHHVNVSCDYLTGSSQSVTLAPRDFEVTAATAKKPHESLATGAFRKVWLASTRLFVNAERPFATTDTTTAPPPVTGTEAPTPDVTTTTTTAAPAAAPAPAPAPAPPPPPPPPPPCTAGAPTLTAPPDYYLVVGAANPPTFQWSYGDPCAAQSFVIVVTDADGGQVAGGTVAGTQWTPGRFAPGRQYYWRVAAVHDGVQGPFSATRTFVVR